jgi:hypothetical protein
LSKNVMGPAFQEHLPLLRTRGFMRMIVYVHPHSISRSITLDNLGVKMDIGEVYLEV